jgi:hypothetical protein
VIQPVAHLIGKLQGVPLFPGLIQDDDPLCALCTTKQLISFLFDGRRNITPAGSLACRNFRELQIKMSRQSFFIRIETVIHPGLQTGTDRKNGNLHQ